ncbi:MAG: secretin and TonB N-terminal domain-containing protein [Candidatus Omnitrophica bacterium]|nr:secretin and TonB N-terminal domain-containing protein [Candidatus Omnitrophota bacterium]
MRLSFKLYFVLVLSLGLSLSAISLRADEEIVSLKPSEKISLDYNDVSLISVLKSIAYSYNFNIVITKNVIGKVSAQLKDVSLDEALHAILSVNGYAFTRKGNIVYIMPKSEVEQVSESVALSYLPAKEAKQLLSKSISSKGDIEVNESTNSLVIKDFPQNIERVRKLIADIDTAPIQVLIEARIVDIDTKEFENIGTSLKVHYNPISGHLGSLNATVNALGIAPTDTTGTGQFSLSPKWRSFSTDLVIDALVQENKARILASPSIATLNGQEARIIIGQRYPYTQSTSVTGSTSTSSTQFVDVGTSLRVIPMVSPDGWITMKVHPEVSSVVDVTSAGPQIDTREADAMIRVKDNETIVIGGLIKKEDTREKNGVPVLRSIPILGWLFRQHSSTVNNTELTVFITPHIIRSPKELPVKSSEPREVYVDPKSFGKDTDLLSGLLKYTEDLEKDLAENPSDDLYRNAQLIKTYKMIFEEFPLSGKSDFCLYKICEIYVKKFGKCDAAQASLTKLKNMFEDSPYIEVAEELVNTCLDEENFANDVSLDPSEAVSHVKKNNDDRKSN